MEDQNFRMINPKFIMKKIENKKMLLLKAKRERIINTYLLELNLLLKRKIDPKNLLSIEETDTIIRRRKEISNTIPNEKLVLNFDAKDKLLNYLAKMAKIKKGKVYLFTEYSKSCGAVLLNSLTDFNHDFSFKDEHSGIISFLSEDLDDKLILDFYQENDQYILEIETQGYIWNSVLYEDNSES